MRTVVCQQCGKEFGSRNAYRAKYCSRECFGLSLRNPDRRKKCKVCGKEFYQESITSKYCSKECRLKAGWNKKDPSKWSKFICDWCGKEFEEYAYRQPRFCSRQCVAEFAAKQPKPNSQKPEIHIQLTCEICGKLYQTTTHQVRERGSRFCSRKCMGIAKSNTMRGEGNPNWNGGTLDPDAYGPNWGRQSRKAKKRDKHTCQVCGYKSGGDRILDVHHIKPIKEFNGNWKLANQLYNLISLCRPCHRKVEVGKIPCPVPKGALAMDLY